LATKTPICDKSAPPLEGRLEENNWIKKIIHNNGKTRAPKAEFFPFKINKVQNKP
jgi:hypothetical protein